MTVPPRTECILQVAVPTPLRRQFDYLPAADGTLPQPGSRVQVPFGRGTKVGLVLGSQARSGVPGRRLKRLDAVLDPAPVIPADLLQLLGWAANYYHHPIGEVVSGALPTLLRQGRDAAVRGVPRWRLSEAGAAVDPQTLARAPRQAVALQRLREFPEGAGAGELEDLGETWRATLARLVDKGWVQAEEGSCLAPALGDPVAGPALNPAQHEAVEAVAAALGGFASFLLEGVTGSGKTEVYLHIIERALAADRQALVLIPEIGLTPQLLRRFRRRFAEPVAVLHSGLSDQERLCAWLAARDGEARIVIGTRSAVFTPLARPGVIIIDEEHDASFKQQDGFRYSARDVALVRAQRAGVPILLGSATPSLESLHNVAAGRHRRLHLPERAGTAIPPRLSVLDVRSARMEDQLSEPLLQLVGRHLDRGGQVLLFLNRRGYAPTLLCHDCGWVAGCQRCDARMTVHQRSGRLRCHHCGAERRLDVKCPSCGKEDLRTLGAGTERVEQTLAQRFPDHPVIRIDRDTTRRKGSMEALLAQAKDGSGRLLVGTQMLAKGHHFPDVTLVGIVDADQGLYSADFRAGERLAQLVVQVAGRAGRAERPGEVVIQTHHPEHPLLRMLIERDYAHFAEAALVERRQAELPPYAHIALLRAEAVEALAPTRFLEQARDAAQALGAEGVLLLGPVPAPMERRAGRYRAQLLLQAEARGALHRLLGQWAPQLESLKAGRQVRWSLDVDPIEMF